MDDRWYKNALIYEVSVRTFRDSNGDGIGDLRGLADRLDHLAALGVTCLWLLPFQPSPWRDDGYDITDHCGVHPDLGSLSDFVQLVHQADDLGMRVIVDLVLNHTSNEHPWFRAARAGHPKYRDYYVWSKSRPPDAEKGIVFPGIQKTTWTFDRKSRQYYFHRFYDFQPDLNIANPEVREEMQRILAFWLRLGIAGFRVDAVPFLIEPAGAEGSSPGPRFEYLHDLRNLLSWRRGDAVMLGEANVDRDSMERYYGVGGLHMLFNFDVNRSLWLALARQDAGPVLDALKRTAAIPHTDQWANFLRNHDEVDLGKLSDDERNDAFEVFAPTPRMQLFGRGIRRRLAPMLGGDRARLELAFSLLLTLPGTPVLYQGDEIGMGEDLTLPERGPVRTAMQWEAGRNAGFSAAQPGSMRVPLVTRGPFGYRSVNVADQARDPASLLSWLERAIRVRSRCPELVGRRWEPVATGCESVLGLRFGGGGERGDGGEGLIVLHNLAAEPRRLALRLGGRGRAEPRAVEEVFANRPYDDGGRRIEIDAYGYRWIRTA